MRLAWIPALLLALPAFGEGTAGSMPRLATADVVLARIPEVQTFDATLEAVNQATVAAQTSGRVLELPFDVNDYVEKGEIIVRFRDTEQRAAVASAEADLKEAGARLQEARSGHNRGATMYQKRLIAKADLDRLSANLEASKARVQAARARLSAAREQLDNTVVRAPYSGIVLARHIELGETAQPGTALISGLSLEHLRAIVDIPQGSIMPLRAKNAAALVHFPDGTIVDAKSIRITPSADASTHTFRVRVDLPQGNYGMYPGQLVKVSFVSGDKPALMVPDVAVVRRSEVTAVYVVGENDRVHFRLVRIGTPLSDGRVPVLAGLQAGEKVATDPVAAVTVYKDQARGQ